MAERARDPLDSAVARLADPAGEDPAHAPTRPDDPAADALSVLGVALGRPLAIPTGGNAGLDPADAAAAASGWFPWRVNLSGRWWDRVTTPMLVRASGAPAVVLPGPGRAELITSPGREVRPLTARSAADVEPDAMAVAVDPPADARWTTLVRWSLSRQRSDAITFLGLAALGGVAALLLPVATGAVFASAIPEGEISRAAVILVAFAVASVGAAVIALVRGVAVVRLRDRMDTVLSPGVMARLLRLGVGFFRDRSVGDVANRALSVEAARQQVDDAVLSLVITSAFGLVSIGFLFAAGAGIAVLTTVTVVAVLGVSVFVQWRARARSPRLLDRRSRSDAVLLSLLDTVVTWRVAGAEDRALAEWARSQQASTGALRDRLRAVSLAAPVEVAGPVVVLAVFTAAVVAMPGDLLQPGSSTAPGVFLAMYAAIIQVTIAMLALGANLLALSEYGPVLSRLRPILTEPPERPAGAERPGDLGGAVQVLDVTFGYDDERGPLFRGLTLDVPAGQLVAVVGPSGSGKSTLLRLLLGFETPWEGSVLYDGRDLARLDPTAVRRQLGVVLQGARPLGATVRECVAGPRHLGDEEIWEHLAQAGLADDVRAFPRRLDEPVGDLGAALSGGQRQRLMIATALARSPRLLLLDEATSALDNVTQGAVMRSLQSLAATRILVAHRLSTVRAADRVVVVSGGRIVEDGTPDELAAAGGTFARLAARQTL